MIKKISLINGPNLNLLGNREIDKYGNLKLEDLIYELNKECNILNLELFNIQSNSESEIVNYIHKLKNNNIEFILINAASLTHTSISIRDALIAVSLPLIEIHITNIFSREPFRRFSYISDIAIGVICGLGIDGYKYALHYSSKFLNKN
ncbi:3-dehydroquinate dehydratase [endosymbiont of Sipalinus gigas]|uniref:type II 3-dehydroquinate dehydratase n=1 Tax=endosymbiont of Sipalinus gigas TaxID=1972134 RepID=UPI000DC6F5DA|nr:type II 3-dehydroquinate dehydratase [endosymbiont of Sipalinus gigas]BBA85287.1 3-dehydroquinate dehydratase [endosymbiont of Sipalinus gigas]